MKYLILMSLLVSTVSYGEPAKLTNPELQDLSKKAIALVKDIEVEKMLESSSEFTDCKSKAKFEDAKTGEQKEDQIKAAQECFSKKLGNKTNAEELKKLSENLNLESYGLVQSKTAKDIQGYLTKKMTKSLTGIDPDERDRQKLIDSMDFNNKQRKVVDQKIFLQLYTAQLVKSSLFEISSFCFEKLRLKNKGKDDFVSHWKDVTKINFDDTTDDGDPAFGKFTNAKSKDEIYKSIFESIQGSGDNVNKFKGFFLECAYGINVLCSKFETSVKANGSTPGYQIGANACLTKSNLIELRKALADSKKITTEFDEMSKESMTLALSSDRGVTFFGRSSKEEESIDNLTTYTTSDFIGEENKDAEFEKKQEDCTTTPELSSCEEFISIGDGLDKVKYNYEIQMTLKQEVEKARIKALYKDKGLKENLTKYLEANGHFNILKNQDIMKDENLLIAAIGDSFEAKKKATLKALTDKMGSRQMTQEKANKKSNLEANITKNIAVSKNERVRLAQVVLFNNIITSFIELSKDEGGGKLVGMGKNVNAWKKEQKGLEASKAIDGSVFSNLERAIEPNKGGGSTKDSNIMDFQLLDNLLGKEKDTVKP